MSKFYVGETRQFLSATADSNFTQSYKRNKNLEKYVRYYGERYIFLALGVFRI
jgi:hypothetical protein